MTGKNKKDLQKENTELKEELTDMKKRNDELSGKLICLETQMDPSNLNCKNCEKALTDLSKVKNHEVNQSSSTPEFKCDKCKREFDQDWKMQAHMKEHSKKQCERCTKTFKYEEIKKKHMQITHENAKIF